MVQDISQKKIKSYLIRFFKIGFIGLVGFIINLMIEKVSFAFLGYLIAAFFNYSTQSKYIYLKNKIRSKNFIRWLIPIIILSLLYQLLISINSGFNYYMVRIISVLILSVLNFFVSELHFNKFYKN